MEPEGESCDEAQSRVRRLDAGVGEAEGDRFATAAALPGGTIVSGAHRNDGRMAMLLAPRLVAFDDAGRVLTAFGTGGEVDLGDFRVNTTSQIVPLLREDGALDVVSHAHTVTTPPSQWVAVNRVSSSGRLDTSFGSGGLARLQVPGEYYKARRAERHGGRLYVAGDVEFDGTTGEYGQDIFVARFCD